VFVSLLKACMAALSGEEGRQVGIRHEAITPAAKKALLGWTGEVAKLASMVGLEDRQLSDLLSRASIDRMIFWPWRASAAR
jgi:nicotinamidase-related amidase